MEEQTEKQQIKKYYLIEINFWTVVIVGMICATLVQLLR